MTDPREVARRALAATRRDDVLVTVTRERSTMRRFARSRPTQATSIDDVTVEVAVAHHGHVSRATTNRTDPEGLTHCAEAAMEATRMVDPVRPGEFPGFPAPVPVDAHGGHDSATAALDPKAGRDALEAIVSETAAHGCEASGIWSAGEVHTAIASSTGLDLSDEVTDAFVKVVAFAPGGRSGYAAQTAVAQGALDPRAVAARAASKTAVDGSEVTLAPGEYPVVMEPHATRELLEVLAVTAFDGLAHTEGRGALTGRIGTRVVAAAVNLSDSPRFASTLPRAFDAEGVPKAPLPLIQDGVAHRVVHNTRSAALAHTRSTGHALAAGDADGPRPTNLVMLGGGAVDELQLCAGIERGIYVTRLWYTNVLRERESLFTAVTRDGTFLIEEGRVTRPLADVRITDSALGVLSRTRALGSRAVLCSDGELYGRRFATGTVCPPLRAEAVRVTGSGASP